MPLLKRKPFLRLEPPTDLKPNEPVFQVRFTKEIFRNYSEYLARINLYRQRVWTCKVTGRSNLTYEEALVSERHGTEKVQQIPKYLVAPILQTVQFSMLQLQDLVNTIAGRLKDQLSEGVGLFGKKDGYFCPCKVRKILNEIDGKPQYEVEWLDKDGKIAGKSTISEDDLIRKKLSVTREVLKSFIRDSTRQNAPWVLHDKLAKKHGISTNPPEDSQQNFVCQDGFFVRKKRKKSEDEVKGLVPNGKVLGNGKSIEANSKAETDDKKQVPQIKYPIDDLLLQLPGEECRPSPAREFSVPMESVGNLLMIWDFCSSFGRFLNLSPFSLEDFGNAISHTGSNVVLVVESHASLFRLLIKDEGDYFTALQENDKKSKMALVNWTEYLCIFLDMIEVSELSESIPKIKRGDYGLLDVQVKLKVLSELVKNVVDTDLFRQKLEENIEERKVFTASRRGEVMEESRKRREQKERVEGQPLTNGHYSPARSPSRNTSPEQNGTAEIENKDQKIPTNNQTSNSRHKRGREEQGDDKEQRIGYLERELEKRIICVNPLGRDRDYNRYWFFRRDGRVFIESCDFQQWGYYSTKEELDAFMHSLNCNGVREKALHKQFTKHYEKISLQMQKRCREESKKAALEEVTVRRSSRIKAPPRCSPFLEYVNKWKEDGVA